MKTVFTSNLFIPLVLLCLLMGITLEAASADYRYTIGHVEWVRVHDVGHGYGPSHDSLDADVIVKLVNSDYRFGFQLRQDENLPVRLAMLEMLLDARRHDEAVNIHYREVAGRNNHELYLVAHGPR